MLIKRISNMTGAEHSMEIDVTPEQIEAWENGMLIQDAMPQLTPDEREYIKSGTTAQEWADEIEIIALKMEKEVD